MILNFLLAETQFRYQLTTTIKIPNSKAVSIYSRIMTIGGRERRKCECTHHRKYKYGGG